MPSSTRSKASKKAQAVAHTPSNDSSKSKPGLLNINSLKSIRLNRNQTIAAIIVFTLVIASIVFFASAANRKSIKLSFGGGEVSLGGSSNNDLAAANISKLLAATSRNRSADKPSYVNKPSAGLENDTSLYSSAFISSYNNSTDPSVTPGEGFGEFRAECDFSHYAYDDPIVYPGQPGKAHLHMIFGNTRTNAYSKYNDLLNSGNSTCNGHEINRTAYWVPALIDQDGNPRKPIKALVYYKSYSITNTNTESWAPGNNGLQYVKPYVFPEGLMMVNNFTRCTAPNISWTQVNLGSGCPTANQQITTGANNKEIRMTASWTGGIVWDNGSHNGGDYETYVDGTQIPSCPATGSVNDNPVRTLQQHVVFPYCSNNKNDMTSRDYSSISKDMQWNISWSWFFAVCPSSHPYKVPQIQYKISYPIYPGEDTSKWYLSSDIDHLNGQIKTTTYEYYNEDQSTQTTKTAKNGATSHGDWFGAWNRVILDKWVKECSQVDGADCAEGVFPVPVSSATKALIKPTKVPLNPNPAAPDNGWHTLRYNDVFRVNGQQLHSEICGKPKLFTVGGAVPKGADIAYCIPH